MILTVIVLAALAAVCIGMVIYAIVFDDMWR